jgi:glycosyltransferase involved in cell wall biosynthesis
VTADDVPRVSVIVPFLTQERILSEAVESVLAQTYDDWELLLVDDGSTDASPDIVCENADRRPGRIAFPAHPKGAHGPPLARNARLRHAAGDYVAFLDAEDVWLPRKLEKHTAIPRPVSTFVQRALAGDVGGLDTTVPDVYDDQASYAKICLRAPVLASRTVWGRYRQHAGSSTTRAASRGDERAVRARLLTSPIRYLSAQGLQDSGVYATLERQPFARAQPLLSRLPTRFRLGA